MTISRSRLAPSPTGALHLGNARTFIINWALARQRHWKLLLRIEDLDSPRVKSAAIGETIDILSWLGIDYDGEALVQSQDLAAYRQSMEKLASANLCYPCELTRAQIEAVASAPQADSAHEGELRFPASLRPSNRAPFRIGVEQTNYRFAVPDGAIVIHDEFCGDSTHDVASQIGDFVIWTKRGVPAYQLAVVVDDARQGITDVVRGDDLLSSAARQTHLYHALGLIPPRWWHLPLVLGPDGRRLAKRHGDTRIDSYRAVGTSPERIIGLLAFWSGVSDSRREMSASDFRDAFDPARLSRDPIIFHEVDHQWLLNG
jgi:glutamyl-tRNA synthetase